MYEKSWESASKMRCQAWRSQKDLQATDEEKCQGEIELESLEKEKKFHIFSKAYYINHPLPTPHFLFLIHARS